LGSSPATNIDDAPFLIDIFDPRYWDSLDPQQVDILAVKGPKKRPINYEGSQGYIVQKVFYNVLY
jgi:hypothetical protein